MNCVFSSAYKSQCRCNVPKSIKVLLFSTKTLQSNESSNASLFRRIALCGNPRVSMVPILDQWVQEGKTVEQQELISSIRHIKYFKRFKHALEISEWMTERRNFAPSPGDIAIQLDLISKVRGSEAAENYFNEIPDELRSFQVYGSLLICYANNNSLEKAEALMQKMMELKLVRSTLPYNVMLNLYHKMGKHDKVDNLVQLMKSRGIHWNGYTLNMHLNSYADIPDIEAMEKLLMEMEGDLQFHMTWNAYAIAARGYTKAGLRDKASQALKKSEHLIFGKSKRFAYEMLLSLHAGLGNKDEVYRLWNKYKEMGKIYNLGYLVMISSLMKLDDIGGAEKLFVEWESVYTSYDSRVPNLMVTGYCKKGLLQKAEAFIDTLKQSGKEPNSGTWDRLTAGYCQMDQMDRAVDTLKKAILENHYSRWKPRKLNVSSCLKYLKEKGDVESAEDIVRLLTERCNFPTETFDSLMNYINNEGAGGCPFEQMGGVDQDPEEGLHEKY